MTDSDMQAHDFLKFLAKVQVNVLCPFTLIFFLGSLWSFVNGKFAEVLSKQVWILHGEENCKDATCNIF